MMNRFGNFTGNDGGNDGGRRPAVRGFTLVEILIVVVIIGILAAIAVPKLSNASQTARENTLRDDVRFLRTQIQVYHSQHNDIYPGYPGGDMGQTPTATDFVGQLTLYSDQQGSTAAAGSAQFVYGPYLTKMPDNPVNYMTTLKLLGPGDALTPDGTTGWLYQPSTGRLLPNLLGSDATGAAFASY